MADQQHEAALNSFSARAHNYNLEAAWMTDASLISPLIPPPFGQAAMLDVCAGTGSVARLGQATGWSVIAADLSPDMLQQASHFVQTVLCDAMHLPFLDAQFDLIVCRQGLQYLDVPAALKEFQRVARQEVRVAHITMFQPDDYDFWLSYFSLVSPGRRHIFKPGDIASSMGQVGLSVIEQMVIVRQDNLAGSLVHLSNEKAAFVRKLFATAPPFIQERYHIQPSDDGNFVYDHRWEFIVSKVSAL